jgi:hypothetical protein
MNFNSYPMPSVPRMPVAQARPKPAPAPTPKPVVREPVVRAAPPDHEPNRIVIPPPDALGIYLPEE